jgi:hypothetical protein
MDKAFENLLLKAPELAALLIVVGMFLKYLVHSNAERGKRDAARDEFIKMMHDDHIEARTESRKALQDNAIATRENTEALQELRTAVNQSHYKVK